MVVGGGGIGRTGEREGGRGGVRWWEREEEEGEEGVVEDGDGDGDGGDLYGVSD